MTNAADLISLIKNALDKYINEKLEDIRNAPLGDAIFTVSQTRQILGKGISVLQDNTRDLDTDFFTAMDFLADHAIRTNDKRLLKSALENGANRRHAYVGEWTDAANRELFELMLDFGASPTPAGFSTYSFSDRVAKEYVAKHRHAIVLNEIKVRRNLFRLKPEIHKANALQRISPAQLKQQKKEAKIRAADPSEGWNAATRAKATAKQMDLPRRVIIHEINQMPRFSARKEFVRCMRDGLMRY